MLTYFDQRWTPDGYEVTDKDRMRVSRLVAVAMEQGFAVGLQKAERDAVKIETPQKAAARAHLLERLGQAPLAMPFRKRFVFLKAQGLS